MKTKTQHTPGPLFHFVMTDGQQHDRDAFMTREQADSANAFLAQNTDWYWAEKHFGATCPECAVIAKTEEAR